MKNAFRHSMLVGAALSALVVGGCNFAAPGTPEQKSEAAAKAAPAVTSSEQAFASHDDVAASEAEDKQRPTMQAQVLLDRLGFAPGVIDDKMGMSTVNAIKGFQEANNLPQSGKLDEATTAAILKQKNLPATRMVTIPQEFLDQQFVTIPADAEAKGKLPALAYENAMEALAERFHTTPAALAELNPGLGATVPTTPPPHNERAEGKPVEKVTPPADKVDTAKPQQLTLAAGQQIRVPNIGGDAVTAVEGMDAGWKQTLAHLGVATAQPEAAKIVVSKSKGTLRAYDASGKMLVQFTATMGSQHDPLPLGEWKVTGIAHNPTFNYNPELFWDVDSNKPKVKMPAGPNSPVGVVWIDINKPHYGIHGTPAPETIGRAESHGCVRLTNWDAARLAMMVKPGTQVLFEA